MLQLLLGSLLRNRLPKSVTAALDTAMLGRKYRMVNSMKPRKKHNVT